MIVALTYSYLLHAEKIAFISFCKLVILKHPEFRMSMRDYFSKIFFLYIPTSFG